MQELLTVEEVVREMRTTSTTVYRWLHTGRLTGIKIGKEWRIPATNLKSLAPTAKADKLSASEGARPAETAGQQSFWDGQADGAHILALCEQQDDVYKVEAGFFNAAAARDQQIFKACWWQDPAELAEHYADVGADFAGMRQDGLLRVVDLNDAYQEDGPLGAVRIWQHEIAARGTSTLWACGSPSPTCFGPNGVNRMLEFEEDLHSALVNAAVIGLCTYCYHDIETGGFSLIAKLIEHHNALALFSDDSCKMLNMTA